MKLNTLHENNKYDGQHTFRLKDGQTATAAVEYYQTPKGEDKYEILVYVNSQVAGNFTLGIYNSRWFDGDVAQMDAHVKGKFRRLGIATGAYDIADKIATDLGVPIVPANDISDLGAAFRASRL